MSTRSIVGVMYEDGSTASIYVHNDGYPDHMCSVLQHYTTQEQVQGLIECGDASAIEKTIQESEFYTDRGDYSPAMAHDSLSETLVSAIECDAMYSYVFSVEDNDWMVFDLNKDEVQMMSDMN